VQVKTLKYAKCPYCGKYTFEADFDRMFAITAADKAIPFKTKTLIIEAAQIK